MMASEVVLQERPESYFALVDDTVQMDSLKSQMPRGKKKSVLLKAALFRP